MIKQLTRITLLLSFFLLNACGNSAPSSAPANFRVVAGENSVTVSWDQQPGVNYYVFAGPGTAITRDNVASTPGSSIQPNATSPFVVTGLTNGQVYSFFMNAANGGSEGGPVTPTLTATPQQAGAAWSPEINNAGVATLPSNIGDGSFTTTSLAYINNIYVAVGCKGTLGGTATTSTNQSNASCTGSSIYTSPGGIGATFAAIPTSTAYAGALQLNDVIAVNQTVGTFSVQTLVAVGNNGTIVSSNDAITWTTETALPALPTNTNLTSVTSNTSTFVAVGNGGAVVTSNDGITWTTQTTTGLPTTVNLNSVTYSSGTGLFYAVGDGGVIYITADGVTWAQTASSAILLAQTPTSQANITANLHDILYSSLLGTYVAVGDKGTLLYSTDGATWYLQSNPSLSSGIDLYSVSGISQFVVTGINNAAVAVTTISTANGSVTTPGAAAGSVAILYGAPATPAAATGPQPYVWVPATISSATGATSTTTTGPLYAVITAYNRLLAAGVSGSLIVSN